MVKTSTIQKNRRILWKTAHASVRGSSHVRSGLPNQDSAACSVIDGDGARSTTAVVAVSDGHGGARHFRSQVGSALAVNISINVVRQFLTQFDGSAGAASLTQAHIHALQQTLVADWTQAVLSDFASNPFTEEELDPLDAHGEESRASVEESPVLAYGATLLIAAGTEQLLIYLQLGDGEILSVSADGVTARPLPADDRLVGNQTTSLCQPDAWNDFRSAWVVAPNLPALVLLSTDGYMNSFRSDEDFLKIGADYLQILREQGIASLSEEMPAILEEATRQGSGDDITLAVLQGNIARSSASAQNSPRPPISPASRSALIEQLKARHSSQDRRIEELSSRLEQTSKANRRLRNIVLLAVLCALAAAAWFYRDRIFHSVRTSDSHPQVGGGANGGGNGNGKHQAGEKDIPNPSGGSPHVVIHEWLLSIANGPVINLKKKLAIANNDMVPGQSSGEYAEVAEQQGVIILINRSKDLWKARTGAGKEKPIKNGEHVVLGPDPIEVTFNKDVSGKITPVVPPPAQTSPQQGAPQQGAPAPTPDIPGATGGL